MEIFKDVWKDIKLVIFKSPEQKLIDIRLLKLDNTIEEFQEYVTAMSEDKECETCDTDKTTTIGCYNCYKKKVDDIIISLEKSKLATELVDPIGLKVWNNITI
jgi:hypothetical protein